MNAPAFTVQWCVSWQGKPVLRPEECNHSSEFGADVLSINQRLEPTKRGQQVIAMDGAICMRCGSDVTSNFSFVDGLAACMGEHGWNREAMLRLYDIAAAHEAELMEAPAIPLWCLYAFGWTGREIVEALNAEKLLAIAALTPSPPPASP